MLHSLRTPSSWQRADARGRRLRTALSRPPLSPCYLPPPHPRRFARPCRDRSAPRHRVFAPRAATEARWRLGCDLARSWRRPVLRSARAGNDNGRASRQQCDQSCAHDTLSDASARKLPQVAANLLDRLANPVEHTQELLGGGCRIFRHQHLSGAYLRRRQLLERAIDRA